MARRKIKVDRDKLEQAVRKAEENGPLKNISALTVAVSEIYNADNPEEPLNPQVVGLRLKEFAFELKTKKGKRGRPSGVPNAARPDKPAKSTPGAKVPKEPKPKPKPEQEDTRPDFRRMLNILTPAGKCPVKLTGTTKEEVRTWAEAVVEAGYKDNRNFTFNAVKYFVRHFYDMFSEDWHVVVGHLDMWMRQSKGEVVEEDEE